MIADGDDENEIRVGRQSVGYVRAVACADVQFALAPVWLDKSDSASTAAKLEAAKQEEIKAAEAKRVAVEERRLRLSAMRTRGIRSQLARSICARRASRPRPPFSVPSRKG
jgi:hypothetical protein